MSRAKPDRDDVVLTMPRESWELLRETLELDARSSSFDGDLRRRIREALASVTRVDGPDGGAER